MTLAIRINDQSFELHPSGVLFWKEKSILLISDVHLGKVSHFRKFGAAVPQYPIRENYAMMDRAITYFNPGCICFMGDLFHSALNKEWQLFEAWVGKCTADIILVTGNHDIISPLKYEAMGIQVMSEMKCDDFLLTHIPELRPGFFNFSGHIHPAVRLRGAGRQSIRLPCFFKSQNQLILPAFGKFTGTYVLRPKLKDEVFAIADAKVIKI